MALAVEATRCVWPYRTYSVPTKPHCLLGVDYGFTDQFTTVTVATYDHNNEVIKIFGFCPVMIRDDVPPGKIFLLGKSVLNPPPRPMRHEGPPDPDFMDATRYALEPYFTDFLKSVQDDMAMITGVQPALFKEKMEGAK